jgi:chaperonin cofactor prefoldin
MNNHRDAPSSTFDSGDELALRVKSLESQCEQLVIFVKSLRQELHDGLSQQIAGAAMMADRLADSLKTTGALQADKAEQLAAAIEGAKRQTFELAERLKQIEPNLH